MKKLKFKSMSPIQILATIALVIAILWTLKFVFELSSSGVKEVSKKISKSSSLPILQCVVDDVDGSKKTIIYDLQEIERLDPTNDKDFEGKKQNGEWTSLGASDHEYIIREIYIENGIQDTRMTTITRKSGKIEIVIIPPHNVNIDFEGIMEVMSRAKRFTGVCEKKEEKNL